MLTPTFDIINKALHFLKALKSRTCITPTFNRRYSK